MGLIWFCITTLVGGTIIGLLGKFVAPGWKDNISFLTTIVCGIVGMIVGSLLYYAIFGVSGRVAGEPGYGWDNTSRGIDWWRHVWQIGTAAIAVMFASATSIARSR
ncbi:hypothetical protein [Nocardioides insulae]|uniref:hypothetical protein n=1 Tax=Nocardioides insulae TaxID=394734 RepID=UPI0003F9DD79|nr:hypothetical protein [Nocardioides insulae]